MKQIYRLRGIDKVLGEKYRELEKQSIYFASPLHLNDPMEGFRDVFWQGDVIVWKNLFKHYLLCLEQCCALLLLSTEEPLKASDIPVFLEEDELPTEQYKNIFKTIRTRFFTNPYLTTVIEQISSRSTPIRRDELIFYITNFHFYALQTIYSVYEENRLIPSQRTKMEDADRLLKGLVLNGAISLMEAGIKEDKSNDKLVQSLFSAQQNAHSQLNLIRRLNLKKDDFNKSFILLEFVQHYVAQLEKLVFPDWYTACFMSECTNSSVWGHYTDGHKGICLIFETEKIEESDTLKLRGQIGYGSNGPIYDFMKLDFQAIDYEYGLGQIDFFRMLGQLPFPKLYKNWYQLEGESSICAEDIQNSKNDWRERYWDNMYRDISIKTKDWEYEKEHRLILVNSMGIYSEENNRTLTYEFKSLQGIIFGIKTAEEDKLKILKIIEDKCKENSREDFSFYQARYSVEKKCIVHDELTLLSIHNNQTVR